MMGIVGTGIVGTEQTVGTGIVWTAGNGNSRDWVDRCNGNGNTGSRERKHDIVQRDGRGREQTLTTVRVGKPRSGAENHTVSRSRPVRVPTTFSWPDFYRGYPDFYRTYPRNHVRWAVYIFSVKKSKTSRKPFQKLCPSIVGFSKEQRLYPSRQKPGTRGYPVFHLPMKPMMGRPLISYWYLLSPQNHGPWAVFRAQH